MKLSTSFLLNRRLARCVITSKIIFKKTKKEKVSQVVTRRSGPTQQATCLCLSTFFENNIFCECFYASGYFFFFVNREKKVFIFRKF